MSREAFKKDIEAIGKSIPIASVAFVSCSAMFIGGYFEEIGFEFAGIFSIQDNLIFFISFTPYLFLTLFICCLLLYRLFDFVDLEKLGSISHFVLFVSFILYILIFVSVINLREYDILYFYSIAIRRLLFIISSISVLVIFYSKYKNDLSRYVLVVFSLFILSYKS